MFSQFFWPKQNTNPALIVDNKFLQKQNKEEKASLVFDPFTNNNEWAIAYIFWEAEKKNELARAVYLFGRTIGCTTKVEEFPQKIQSYYKILINQGRQKQMPDWLINFKNSDFKDLPKTFGFGADDKVYQQATLDRFQQIRDSLVNKSIQKFLLKHKEVDTLHVLTKRINFAVFGKMKASMDADRALNVEFKGPNGKIKTFLWEVTPSKGIDETNNMLLKINKQNPKFIFNRLTDEDRYNASAKNWGITANFYREIMQTTDELFLTMLEFIEPLRMFSKSPEDISYMLMAMEELNQVITKKHSANEVVKGFVFKLLMLCGNLKLDKSSNPDIQALFAKLNQSKSEEWEGEKSIPALKLILNIWKILFTSVDAKPVDVPSQNEESLKSMSFSK